MDLVTIHDLASARAGRLAGPGSAATSVRRPGFGARYPVTRRYRCDHNAVDLGRGIAESSGRKLTRKFLYRKP